MNDVVEKGGTQGRAREAHSDHPEAPEATQKMVRATRWLADGAVLATLVLNLTLPSDLTFGPPWLAPIIGLILLVPLSLTVHERHIEELRWQRVAAVLLIGIISLSNIASLVLLVGSLVTTVGKETGTELILAAAKIWLVNVLVFTLWYWELDQGGPGERVCPQHRLPDFLFPQMTMPKFAPQHWTPSFIDYLYLAFTNATAFSPTDAMPLTRWAKMLMAMQALTSLLTIALVASRAINILGQ